MTVAMNLKSWGSEWSGYFLKLIHLSRLSVTFPLGMERCM